MDSHTDQRSRSGYEGGWEVVELVDMLFAEEAADKNHLPGRWCVDLVEDCSAHCDLVRCLRECKDGPGELWHAGLVVGPPRQEKLEKVQLLVFDYEEDQGSALEGLP